jgi:hypothetical protein
VSSSEECFDLVEEGRDDGFDECTCEFDGVVLISNDSKHHIVMYLIEYCKGGVVDVLQLVGLGLAVHGHFRMILLHLVLHVQYLFVHISLVGLAEDECTS